MPDYKHVTKEQAREILAMRGALDLLRESDQAMELAKIIKGHAERITGCGSATAYPPSLLDVMHDAITLLAGVKTLECSGDPPPLG